MSPKQILASVSVALGLVGAGLMLAPQTSPFGAPLQSLAHVLEAKAAAMPGDCSDAVCGRDPRTGRCSMCGPIALLDGGSCVCR